MIKRRFLAIALGALLVLAACGPATTDTSSDTSVDTSSDTSSDTSTSTSTDTSNPEVLSSPVISLNNDHTGIVWADVANASSYELKVNDGEYAAATEYSFSDIVGSYDVYVVAIGDGTNFVDSEPSVWEYETKAIALDDIARDGAEATWSGDFLSSEIAFSEVGDFEDVEFAASQNETYSASETGKLAVRAIGGYDEVSNVNYVGEPVVKYCNIVLAASENRVLFNGDETDLADLFTIKYWNYSSNSEEVSGSANISAVDVDVEGNGNALKFYYQVGGTYYKYISALEKPIDSYKSISLYAKGDGISEMILQFSGDLYVSYSLGVLSTNWNYINIPFSSTGWKVNGTATTLADAVAANGSAYGIESVNEIVNILPSMTIICKTSAATYNFTNIFADEITLVSDDGLENHSIFDLADRYTGENGNGVDLKIVKTGETTATISSLNLEANLSVDVAVSKENDNLILESLDEGASLSYTAEAGRGGDQLTFVSATGTYAAHFQNVNFNRHFVIDDFESYSETGAGYDKNNLTGPRTGLRANYFSDYYAGSGTSPISGSGWDLMGSTDYLNLNTNAADAHASSKSAQVKVGNAMRHTSYGLYDGTAIAWPTANTFSFWLKSPAAIDCKVFVRLFSVSKVNSSNYGITPTEITYLAGSDWTQYTVPMDVSKTYYGVSFTFEKPSNYATYRPYLDDIELYTTTNPWSTYVPPVINATGVSVTPETASIEEGATVQLTAEVAPAETTNKNVSWSSLDTEIATVDQTGLVTAVAEGATSIVATTEDGGFTDSCALSVTAAAVSNANDPLTKTYTGSVEVSGMGSVYVITALATNYTAYMKIGSEVINSTYTVADNVVTIDTGNANYGVFVGSLSADRNTLTKTSMSGAYAAAVGSLVMNAAMVLEDANGTSTAALQSKYLTQYDTGNGAWTASNSADRIEYDTVNKLEGDGAMKMKNGTFGKMRYKSASMPASLGNFVTFGMWFYNDTGASISAQMFLYSAGGSPFITLVNSLTIPSNSTWTYYTVGFTSYAVAGWSIILPSASATGHPVLDYVTLA